MVSVSCNYMQIWLWYVNHRGEDGHIRGHTSVLIRLVKHTSHVFIYSSKQQCLVKTRCFEGRGGGAHVDECVRHDWLIWTGDEIWTGGKKSGEGWPLLLHESWTLHCSVCSWQFHSISPLLSPSHHFFVLLLSLCYPPSSFLPVLAPCSWVALAHAGSQHQRTLVGDFWVLNHALPQPLFLPIWVHPVYLVPVAFALRGDETNTQTFVLLW